VIEQLREDYLYLCYCGQFGVAEHKRDKSPGFLYKNCPRLTAPMLKTPILSEIDDKKFKKFYNSLDEHIDILISYGVESAYLAGSYITGKFLIHSDIDISIEGGPKLKEEMDRLVKEIRSFKNLPIDIIVTADLLRLMPHLEVPRGDKVFLFDKAINYRYSEKNNLIITM
jgi:predicted nucleotidyltransferase